MGALLVVSLSLPCEAAQISGTPRVVDGDTIDIGVVRVRLHGIDAPEADQTCRTGVGKEWPCDRTAASRLGELVRGKKVTCDALDRDDYGRIISRCRLGDMDPAETLVREGLAWAFRRFSDDYAEQEQEARKAGLGIWDGENQPAWDYRADRWNRAAAASPNGCPIKGNINAEGERIYHTPWSRNYDRTVIDERKGERWFCDEAEALAAGWRPPRG